jgi:hypothetical protein
LILELMFARVLAMSTGEAGDQLHELREAIEGLDLPVHGTVLAEARALLDRLTAALAMAEADYCATTGWQVDGFGSMAAFARHRDRVSDAEGRRITTRAERMSAWPEVLPFRPEATVDCLFEGPPQPDPRPPDPDRRHRVPLVVIYAA